MASAAVARRHLVRILVLSGRSDLIAGGEVLVAIQVPRGINPKTLRVTLGRRNVRTRFARRANGQFEGLLTNLKLGRNVVRAVLPNGYGARIAITNHPNGGPVFSGPQIEPWTCEPGALDRKCDRRPRISYLYRSTDPTKTGLQPYDLANPPSDVAMTTTDAGVRVPFIVREETGFEDRDAYRTEVLYKPGQTWAPWNPQSQWNHKLLIMHGQSCHTDFGVSTPEFDDKTLSQLLSSQTGTTVPENPAIPDSSQVALGRGFAVMSTALDNSGVDCNPVLQAESLMMAKQHLTDEYGQIQFTIGTGCSGGSLAQQWIANAYPGIYQGIIPQCSFPDAGSSAQEVADDMLLVNYFNHASGWTALQQAQVADAGGDILNTSINASGFGPLLVAAPNPPCLGITRAQEYDAMTNPRGVRCGILDWNINLLGPQPKNVWHAQEKAIGRGFAGNPIDNVGVQYGLGALNAGQISVTQFLDLSANIGGLNEDFEPQPRRMAADQPALANAYRDGFINEANNLNQVAIIDLRGPNAPGLAHDSYHTFATQARLDRNFGTHANQVIWEGPITLFGDNYFDDQALIAMDNWLSAVTRDTSSRTLPQKIIADKPADITDECSNGNGVKLSSTTCPASVVPVYGTPRMSAGESVATDQSKCALVPLNRSSYAVTFTDAQWAQMQQTFPQGVCDYSKPGIGQQPALPWLTYQNAQGNVIYGGRSLGPPPVSVPFGPTRP